MAELLEHDLYWCRRRMPKDVMTMAKEKSGKLVIAGGFIRSCVSGETVNDIDLFSPNYDDAKSWAYELKGRGEGRRIVETQNAFSVFGLKMPVQFIHRWAYTTPESVVQSFDFTIAKAALWWERNPAVGAASTAGMWRTLIDDHFYADLAAKRLIYCNPKRNEDAGGSLLRVLKFYQRGYRTPLGSFAATIARLVMAVKVNEVVRSTAEETEDQWAKVLHGLMREVDPNIDPDHSAHLPGDPSQDD